MRNDVLIHYGVLGMRWGIRRRRDGESRSNGLNARQKKIAKRVAVGTLAAATVATASVLYVKNKSKIDGFVKKYMADAKAKSVARSAANIVGAGKKNAAYVAKNKNKILSSPSSILKYKKFLSVDEIKGAKEKLQLAEELHGLSQKKIRRGAEYAQAILAYGTAATAAYGLANSPLAKSISRQANKKTDKD